MTEFDERSIVIYPHYSSDGIRQRRQVADIIAEGQQRGTNVDIVARAILYDLLAHPSHLAEADEDDGHSTDDPSTNPRSQSTREGHDPLHCN